jgi:hypothetical protein
MPGRIRSFASALCALAVATVVTLGPGVAHAASATNATPVPVPAWAAKFCTSFAAYETDALAAQQQLQAAFAGVKDSTAGATATAGLVDAFTKTSASAQAAAAAATANGVPDVARGQALAHEIEQTLADTSKVYAKMAKKASSLPVAPSKLSAAARKVSAAIANALDPKSPHAKRLKKLDSGNTVAKAISADPTCAAAVSNAGSPTPATTTTTKP